MDGCMETFQNLLYSFHSITDPEVLLALGPILSTKTQLIVDR